MSTPFHSVQFSDRMLRQPLKALQVYTHAVSDRIRNGILIFLISQWALNMSLKPELNFLSTCNFKLGFDYTRN